MIANALDRTILICPTLNPGELFDQWIQSYLALKQRPGKVVVIDSSSTDGTIEKAKKQGISVDVISRDLFNHGATRNRAIENVDAYDFVIFVTQDVIFSEQEPLINILQPFEDIRIAAVCGRQLPRHKAVPIEVHARSYNYSEESLVKSLADVEDIGLKAAFLSNSFAAYRLSALHEIGGFPGDVIFGEDMYVAAKLLKADYKIAYSADACVYHSHSYSLLQEFKRYFDMGVFHAREPWLRQEFGSAEGAGVKFVVSELDYLFRHAFLKVPEAILRTLLRYLGFRSGLLESKIPVKFKVFLSMNSSYFR